MSTTHSTRTPTGELMAERKERIDRLFTAGPETGPGRPFQPGDAVRLPSGEIYIVPEPETGPSRPFQPGDVVQLKSGGMYMTVRGQECLGQVALVWSHYGGLTDEGMPAACLKLVDPAELDAKEKRTLKDNIPF